MEQSTLSRNLSENTSISLTIFISKEIQSRISTKIDFEKRDKMNFEGDDDDIRKPKTNDFMQKPKPTKIFIEKFYLLQSA